MNHSAYTYIYIYKYIQIYRNIYKYIQLYTHICKSTQISIEIFCRAPPVILFSLYISIKKTCFEAAAGPKLPKLDRRVNNLSYLSKILIFLIIQSSRSPLCPDWPWQSVAISSSLSANQRPYFQPDPPIRGEVRKMALCLHWALLCADLVRRTWYSCAEFSSTLNAGRDEAREHNAGQPGHRASSTLQVSYGVVNVRCAIQDYSICACQYFSSVVNWIRIYFCENSATLGYFSKWRLSSVATAPTRGVTH